MAINLNPIHSFNDEVSEIEYQVFQTLKWTFYFLTPILSMFKNVVQFYFDTYFKTLTNNDLSKKVIFFI